MDAQLQGSCFSSVQFLSGNQLNYEKQYKGYLSWNDYVQSFEILLSINGITDTGIEKLTSKFVEWNFLLNATHAVYCMIEIHGLVKSSQGIWPIKFKWK